MCWFLKEICCFSKIHQQFQLVSTVAVQAFKRNKIDTNWLDGLIRERAVRLKYEQLAPKNFNRVHTDSFPTECGYGLKCFTPKTDGQILKSSNSVGSCVPHVDPHLGGSPLSHKSGTYNPGDPAHCWTFVILASVSFRTCFCCCSCINNSVQQSIRLIRPVATCYVRNTCQ